MKGITLWKSGRTGRVTYRDDDGNIVPKPTSDYKSFQQRVGAWAHDCFGAAVANDKPIRNFSTATAMINAGVALYTVGQVLGHKSPVSTQRYAHLQQSSLKAAIALVGARPKKVA